MPGPFRLGSMRVALCQIPVSSQPTVNLDRVRAALAEAAAQGADLAVFPEATQIRFGCDPRPAAAPVAEGFGAGLAGAAADTRPAPVAEGSGAGLAAPAADPVLALVAGIFTPAPDGRVYNTAVAFVASGDLV